MIYTILSVINKHVNIFLDELMDEIDDVAHHFGDNSDDSDDEYDEDIINALVIQSQSQTHTEISLQKLD